MNMWGMSGIAARNEELFSSDAHGNTDASYDGTKTVKRYTYDAYGNAIRDNGEDDNPYRYCGENYDEETGLYYLRARYYDPSIGRFMSEDPAQDGLNWYVYCGNNPVMYIDPMGLTDYIFYGNDQKSYAEDYAEKLKASQRNVVSIHATNPKAFIDGWDQMGSDGETIDTVYMMVHGEPEYVLSDGVGQIYSDQLARKEIDTILLISCNTGNMDFNNNFAVQLLSTQTVNQVIAPDGKGYRIAYGMASSFYFEETSGVKRDGNGFVLYQLINGNLHITPNLTLNGAVGNAGISLQFLLKKGKNFAQFNIFNKGIREYNNIMNVQQVLQKIVGL